MVVKLDPRGHFEVHPRDLPGATQRSPYKPQARTPIPTTPPPGTEKIPQAVQVEVIGDIFLEGRAEPAKEVVDEFKVAQRGNSHLYDLISKRVAVDIANVVHSTEDVRAAVNALADQATLAIEAGWHGHTLLCLLTRKGDLFDITIWNTGGGVETYHSIERGKKNRYCPFISFQGVTRDELDLDHPSNDDVFSRIKEIAGMHNGAKSFYTCFAHLLPKRAATQQFFITPQRSKSPLKPWLAYLQSILDQVPYKIIKAKLKSDLLLSFYQKETWKKHPIYRKTLGEGCRKWLRSIGKLSDTSELASQREVMSSILFALEEFEASTDKNRLPPNRDAIAPPASPQTSTPLRLDPYQDPLSVQTRDAVRHSPQALEPLRQVCRLLGMDVGDIALLSVDQTLTRAQLTEVALRLPLNTDFNGVDKRQLLKRLVSLFDLYLRELNYKEKDPWGEGSSPPQFFVAVSSLLCLIHRLAVEIENQGLFSFFPHGWFENILSNPAKAVSDPRLLARLNEIRKALPHPRNLIFGYDGGLDQYGRNLRKAARFFSERTPNWKSLHTASTDRNNQTVPPEEDLALSDLAELRRARHVLINPATTGLPDHLSQLLTAVKSLIPSSQVNIYIDSSEECSFRFGDDRMYGDSFSKIDFPAGKLRPDLNYAFGRDWDGPTDDAHEAGVLILREKKDLLGNRGELPILVRRLRAAVCEDRLSPMTILDMVHGHFDLIADGSVQRAFQDVFFGRDKKNASLRISTIPCQASLRVKLYRFIKEGLSYYSSKDVDPRTNLSAILFLARLCIRIHAIDPTIDLPDIEPVLRDWLKSPTLDVDLRGEIHLHLLMLYSKKEMSNEVLDQILKSWFLFRWSAELHKKEIYPPDADFGAEAEAVMIRIGEHWERRRTLQHLIPECLNELGVDYPEDEVWDKSAPFAFKGGSPRGLEIDLLKGTLRSSRGPICLIEFEGKRQLNEGTLVRISRGATYSDYLGVESKLVYRHYKGQFYMQAKVDRLPHALSKCTAWMNADSDLLVFDQKGNLYATKSRSTKPGCLDLEGRPGLTLSMDGAGMINSIEPAQECLEVRNGAGDLVEIQAPHLISPSRATLKFINQNGRLVWSEATQFFIMKGGESSFGNFQAPLLLSDGTLTRAIIPIVPVASGHHLEDQMRLDISRKPPVAERRFVTCDLVDGEWTSPTSEGLLMLIYIFLAQSDYDRAFKLYLKLSRAETFSKEAHQIFDMILDLSSEKSPQMTAFCLRILFIKSWAILLTEGRFNDTQRRLEKLWSHYLAVENNVPSHLLLTDEERRLITTSVSPSLSEREIRELAENMKQVEIPGEWPKQWDGRLNYLILGVRDTGTHFNSRCQQLLLELVQHPDQAPQIRRALNFYIASSNPSLSDSQEFQVLSATLSNIQTLPPYTKDAQWLRSFIQWIQRQDRTFTFAELRARPIQNDPIKEAGESHDRGLPLQPRALQLLSVHNNAEALLATHFRAQQNAPGQVPKLSITIPESPEAAATRALVGDLSKGLGELSKRSKVDYTPKTDQPRLETALASAIKTVEERLLNAEETAIQIARAHLTPSDLLLEEGAWRPQPTLERLETAFLHGQYRSINRHADEAALDQAVANYLMLATELQHLKRIQKGLNDGALSTAEAGEALGSKRTYDLDAETGRVLLVFEHRSDIRVRSDQAAKLDVMMKGGKGAMSSVLVQMMMGGGKTTVMAAILLEWMSVPGKTVGLFIVPDELFESMVQDCTRREETVFRQTVIPLRVHRADLTRERLQVILRDLQRALAMGQAVLTTKVTLQTLILELLSTADQNMTGALNAKHDALVAILKLLKSHGRAYGDEIHDFFRANHATNYPCGEAKPMEGWEIALVQTTVEALIQGELQNLVLLDQGRQAFLTDQEIQERVLPAVATYLTNHFPTFALIPQQNALTEYLKGVTQEKTTHKDEMAALLTLFQGQEKVATHAAFARTLVSQLLPMMLKKTPGRHYGRSREAEKVVPFSAVNTPTNTEFATAGVTALGHFMTALANPLEPTILKRVIQERMKMAQYEAARDAVAIEDTAAAELFKEMFGVKLIDAASRDADFSTALKSANTPVIKIALERWNIEQVVKRYPEILSCNAHIVSWLLPSLGGLSGTPSNWRCFPPSLQNSGNQLLERSVEGEIITTFLGRQETQIHALRTNRVHEMLRTSGDGACGIIDAAGVLKDETNESIARAVQAHYGTQFETVLYFQGDTLMALRPGHSQPLYIGSTLASELKKHGINPATTFTIYDQRHCQGTDLPQKPDAVNIVTFGPDISLTKLSQAIIRLRQYFKGQRIKLCIPEEAKKYFSFTLEGIIGQAILVEGKTIANETLQAFGQRQEAEVMGEVVETLLTLDGTRAAAYFAGQRARCVQTVKSSAVEAATLPTWANPKELLLRQSPSDALKADIQASSVLPLQIRVGGTAASADGEVNVEQMQENERQEERDVEMETELEKYRTGPGGRLRAVPEAPIKVDQFPSDPIFRPMTALFDGFTYDRPYGDIFKSNSLFVTANLCITAEGFRHSVFHDFQKDPTYLLISTKDRVLRACALTKQDADSILPSLEGRRPKDQWLILASSGQDMTSYQHDPITPDQQNPLNEILWTVGCLRGDIRLILSGVFSEITHKKVADRDLGHLILRYLKLKTHGDPVLLDILKRFLKISEAQWDFNLGKKPDLLTENDVMFVPFLSKPEDIQLLKHPKLIQALRRPQQLRHVVGSQVPHLMRTQVVLLEPAALLKLFPYFTDEQWSFLVAAQIRVVPVEKVPFLRGPAQLKELLPTQLKSIVREQLPDLADAQFKNIRDDLIPFIPLEKVQYLTGKDQMAQITESQLPGLTQYQIPLIPQRLIASLSVDKVQYLTQTQVAHITIRQAPGLSATQIPLIGNELIPHVAVDKVQHVTQAQLAHITALQAPGLSAAQIPRIRDELIPHLQEGQVRHLNQTQIARIILTPPYTEAVVSHLFEGIQAAQIPSLDNTVVRLIPARQELLSQLSDVQREHISDAQVPFINIFNVPQRLLGAATTTQLRTLFDGQSLGWLAFKGIVATPFAFIIGLFGAKNMFATAILYGHLALKLLRS